MERREAEEYDFNEPLLERVVEVYEIQKKENVSIAMFFLLPGRHAGPGGDVAQIIDEHLTDVNCRMTRVIGEHPLFVDALSEQILAGINSA